MIPWRNPAAGLGLVLLLPTACRPTDSDVFTQAPSRVERQLSKERRPADNVRIRATLWDRTLLDPPADDKTARNTSKALEPPDEALARRTRWSERYVDEQTTFTVLIELLNRPRSPTGDDPIADPSKWKFRLDLGDDTDIEPARVEVQTLDRYPSRAHGWHWRLAFAVHFPPDLEARLQKHAATSEASAPLQAKLRVLPPYGDESRPAFGVWTARHGFHLVWRLTAQST
ncbi:MAG: hypothetical protein B7733_05175 [Myxococcales bacterium FL481]|nr:MAG: hypothetical protein B7733_05175 [Myxococcales bacterium FL481]